MTNLQAIGGIKNIEIPKGYYILGADELCVKGDKVALISIEKQCQFPHPFNLTWIDVEAGQPASVSGNVVIRHY